SIRAREMAAGGEADREAELAGPTREGPESPAERVARIRDAEFPDYEWIKVREWTDEDPETQALLNRRTLATDLDFPRQQSMSGVKGINVGAASANQTDEEVIVSLRHELQGHVGAFLAGT